MLLGGIETYLIKIIRRLKKNGVRIIWLSTKDRKIDEGFTDDLLDGNVEIVDYISSGFNWFKCSDIQFDNEEEIVGFAFEPIDFFKLELFRKKFPNAKMNIFYWVPHFSGI